MHPCPCFIPGLSPVLQVTRCHRSMRDIVPQNLSVQGLVTPVPLMSKAGDRVMDCCPISLCVPLPGWAVCGLDGDVIVLYGGPRVGGIRQLLLQGTGLS